MSNKVRGIVLFGLGLLSIVWFFASYAQQEPRSIVSLGLTENNAELTAAETLSEFGFSIGKYETEVDFRSNRKLLDSLQHKLGRRSAIDSLEGGKVNIYPYFWSISFEKSSTSSTNTNNGESNDREGSSNNEDIEFNVELDESGNLIALHNIADKLPSKLVNRETLGAVFVPNADSAAQVFSAFSDSLLSRLMYFDLEQDTDSLRPPNFAERVSAQLQQGRPYRYDAYDAQKMAEYYLQKTSWDTRAFEVDTVFIERVGTENVARVQFKSVDAILDQNVRLNVKVNPTGSLIDLNYTYNPGNGSNGQAPIWGMFRSVLIFLFALAAVILFFFRIKSRAIDTESALVVAVIMGLAVSTLILLGSVNNVDLFNGSSSWIESVMLLVQIGIGGASASLGFFMLFALSDSITRQYWPDKLLTYDYLRRGMLFNKPIGNTLLQGITLGLIVTGIWAFSIWLIPSLYIQVEYVFLDGSVAWPPLFMLLEILALSLVVSLSVFLVVGSQVYAQTKNIVVVSVSTILGAGVVMSLLIWVGPDLEQFILGCILGAVLTFIYLKWDFLTLFLSLFTFLALISSSSGWLIENSPDWYIFMSFVLVLFFLVLGGLVAISKGKEEGVLPKYIPEYVEELAQEERIRQELQIARGVQESFLPVKMPEIEGLDIAALCKPAYETGGDYYDVIKLNDHQVALTIGDVSGKGIPAAFYMTFTKGILHSLCRETDSPSELLIKANRLFCENAKKGTFISLVYGVLDLRKKTFTFARAGHNPILRMNSKTGKTEELKPVGLGLGLTSEAPFERNIKEVELSLTADDTLVLYTDGIVEALNTANKFYGDKQLIDSLKNHLNKSASEILHHLITDVSNFIGTAKQHDDMTVMVLKID
ncbi:MAG: PP2C family protein-serine/threonine phosphatase [Balneolaceae bacterium]|nr:PP2C family protein-serine/threonine phosphatase [Balneolaceae bacterium]